MRRAAETAASSPPPPAWRWVQQWVSQPVAGGQCSIFKWVREEWKAIEEKEVEEEELGKTEKLHPCCLSSCGEIFPYRAEIDKLYATDVPKKFACTYEGCGKTFMRSSTLTSHIAVHTEESPFVCPHPGCGKAYSLEFNLKFHIRTHSSENYHVCPHTECGERYTDEYKLRTHIQSRHEKKMVVSGADKPYSTQKAADKHHYTTKAHADSSDRPYACPYEGCDEAYIHEYKLNLHFRREHSGHYTEENGKLVHSTEQFSIEGNDRDACIARDGGGKNPKRSKLYE